MAWLSVLTGLLQLFGTFTGWLKDQQLIDAGIAEATAAHLQGALDDIRKANAARDAVRTRVSTDPDSVRKPDPFSRD